jgi:hypothetical protein
VAAELALRGLYLPSHYLCFVTPAKAEIPLSFGNVAKKNKRLDRLRGGDGACFRERYRLLKKVSRLTP